MMNWNGPWFCEFWMGGLWILPVLIMLVGIFVCARTFLAGNGRPPFCGPRQWNRHDESAMEIAKRRYAAGEITGEEFEEIKKTVV